MTIILTVVIALCAIDAALLYLAHQHVLIVHAREAAFRAAVIDQAASETTHNGAMQHG